MDIIGPNDAVGQVNVEGQPNKTKRLVIIPLPGGTQSNGLNHHRQPGIYGIRFKLAATEVSAVGAPPTHLHSSPFHSERRSQKISQQASRHVGATPAAFFNDRAAGERKSRRETLNQREKNYMTTRLSAARIPIEREAY